MGSVNFRFRPQSQKKSTKIRFSTNVMASLTSANDEIDEVQNGDLDFNLDEEVAETGDVDEPQPKRGRISSLDKIKELNSKLKKKTPAKAPKKPKEPKVNPKHVEGKTIEQHRRGFGNVIKDHIKV